MTINPHNTSIILAEFNIKKGNEKNRIINSYQQYYKKHSYDEYKKENEKEIKENCEIKINDNKIPFCYFYKFSKNGKYTIKYIFKKYMTKLDYMFSECSSLTNLNLSNLLLIMLLILDGCSMDVHLYQI